MLDSFNTFYKRDFRLSSSVIRVVFGCLGIFIISKKDRGDFVEHFQHKSLELFEPIGVLQLFDSLALNGDFINTLITIGYIACVMQIIGLFSRFSATINVFVCIVLASLSYSWGIKWSHGINVLLIAMLSAPFMPLSSYFSLDRILFKSSRAGHNNGWAINVALISIAMIFLSAGFFKVIMSGHYWVFSDHLRNVIIDRFLVRFSEPLPVHLAFIVNNEWAWKALALGNIAAQLGAIGVIFFFHRPWLKLLFGVFFALEILGLGIIMDYWHLEWLALLVLYIDSDYSSTKVLNLSSSPVISVKAKRYITSGAIAYFLFCTIVMFDPTLTVENKLKTYPISSYPMFSGLQVRKPFDKHLPIHMKGNDLVVTDPAFNIDSVQQEEFTRYGAYVGRQFTYKEIWNIVRIKNFMNIYHQYLKKQLNTRGAIQFEWRRRFNQCPEYPKPATIIEEHSGVVAMMDTNGTIKSVRLQPIGKSADDFYYKILHAGFDNLNIINVFAFEGHAFEGPIEIEHTIKEDRVYVHETERLLHLAITVNDEPSQKQLTFFSGTFKKRANGTLFTN